MLDTITKMINDDNEVLDILPQNNVNNRKKYKAQLTTVKEKYLDMQNQVSSYIISKNKLLREKYNISFESNLHDQIKDLENKIRFFNPYQDAFEILNLDKLFYGLHKYYDNGLNVYNDNINKILDIFNEVGIILTNNDFYYSESSQKYMEVFINEKQKGNYNSDVVKEAFEDLFWKNHNMMRYILLMFYRIYYANEKKFNLYLKKKQMEILAQYNNDFNNIVEKYHELIKNSNEFYLNNKGVFFDKFIKKELTTSDFEQTKMKKIINDYLSSEIFNPEDLFMKLYSSVKEEKFIYQYKYILDEVDKIYKEKDSNKDLFNTTKKEINAIEKKLHDKYKKITGRSFFKKPNKDLLYKEMDELLLELDGKYDVLDESRYKERIGSIVNPKLKDYYLVSSSYLFMNKISKEQEMKTDDIIEVVLKNVYSPYNGLIENINYDNVATLNFIVYDKYKLLGLNLTTDDFNEENLDGLAKVMGNICIYYTITKLGIDILEINFILESDDIIKKMSSC